MRKTSIVGAVIAIGLLTGCGAATSFELTGSALETYAKNNDGEYSDVTADYTDYEYIEGLYVMELDNCHIELWDTDSVDNASSWFQANVDILKDMNTYAGSSSSSGGAYSASSNNTYYKVMFSNDLGIYAYGDKDTVNNTLESLGVK